jgi:hypothetical protein
MMDPRKHNYYRKLMEAYKQGKGPPGRLVDMQVCHDDWGRIHRGLLQLRPRDQAPPAAGAE